jgi:hypothetical protein
MKHNSHVFAMAAIFAGSAFASAQDSSGVVANLDSGTNSIEAAAGMNVMGDDVQFQLAYGRFIADGIELALVGALRDDDEYMSTELGIRGEYNFVGNSRFVPYLDAGIYWANVEVDANNIDTDAGIFAAGAGIKYFISDNFALTLSGTYLLASDDIFVDSEDFEMQGDEFRITFGVRFYFD